MPSQYKASTQLPDLSPNLLFQSKALKVAQAVAELTLEPKEASDLLSCLKLSSRRDNRATPNSSEPRHRGRLLKLLDVRSCVLR